MAASHKNKTFATLLAFAVGALGAHRFYLCGVRDRWGWLHLAALPASLALAAAGRDWNVFYCALPMIVSILAAFIEALVIGLTPDEQWDARHNPASGRASASRWPLAVLLVLTLGVGATALIGAIARLADLLLTGGAYG